MLIREKSSVIQLYWLVDRGSPLQTVIIHNLLGTETAYNNQPKVLNTTQCVNPNSSARAHELWVAISPLHPYRSLNKWRTCSFSMCFSILWVPFQRIIIATTWNPCRAEPWLVRTYSQYFPIMATYSWTKLQPVQIKQILYLLIDFHSFLSAK